MKAFITVCISLFCQAAFGCICSPLPDFKTTADLKDYDFIARAKITRLSPKGYMGVRKNGDINIEVTELFKGNAETVINDRSFNSDCALSLNDGEEWLFFGRKSNGKILVNSCDYSIIYREINGTRSWAEGAGLKQLDALRNIFGKIPVPIPEKVFYSNGQIEIDQHIQNGVLTGVRSIYYPDGKPFVKDEFKKGIHVNKTEYFSPSGQLLRLVTYKNGLMKTVTRYEDTTYTAQDLNMMLLHPDLIFPEKHTKQYYQHMLDSLRSRPQDWALRVESYQEFKANGRSNIYKAYWPGGRLKVNNSFDWAARITVYYRYKQDGKIDVYSMRNQKKDTEIEYDYDYAGQGLRKDFLGPCNLCNVIFDASKPPEATPPMAYIQ